MAAVLTKALLGAAILTTLVACGRPIAIAPPLATRSVSIPFELRQNKVMMRVQVQQDTPRWFVLDTGASVCVIRWAQARTLKLAVDDLGPMEIGGGDRPLHVGLLDPLHFRIGSFEFGVRRAVALNFQFLESY